MNKEEIDYWLKLFSDNNYAFMSKDGKKITLFKVFDKLKKLQQENQELKKKLDKAHDELYSLKNKYNIRLLNQISENIEPDCEDYYLAEIETKAHKYDLTQTQQKEFIKYLEDDLKEKYRDMGYRHNIFREILQKYKSIIGVSNENKRN